MNENLHKYLLGLNCSVINPIKASITSNIIVGYHCNSSSVFRKEEHIKLIRKFISENKIEYHIEPGADHLSGFFI